MSRWPLLAEQSRSPRREPIGSVGTAIVYGAPVITCRPGGADPETFREGEGPAFLTNLDRDVRRWQPSARAKGHI
jgi:hypothetical protein